MVGPSIAVPIGTAAANVHNLKNSKAQNDKEAVTKIKDIEARLKGGEDFGMLAQNYSEDASSAPNGGDMGFVKDGLLTEAQLEAHGREADRAAPPR